MVPNDPNVVLSPLLASASGSVGTVVASRNAHGQFWRTRVTPAFSSTPLRFLTLRRFRVILRAWRDTLTPAQRSSWNRYAAGMHETNRLGESIRISGQNWFARCNLVRTRASLPQIHDAPEIAEAAEMGITFWKVIALPSNVQYSWPFGEAWRSEPGAVMYFYISPEYPASIRAFKPPCNYLASRPAIGPSLGTIPLGPPGTVGAVRFIRYRVQRLDGRLTPVYHHREIVA